MRDGFEYRLHAGTNRFARTRLDQRRSGIHRQSAAERDQLVDLGGGAKAVEPRCEGGIVAAMTCGHQRDAGQLIDAPVAEVEARTQRFGTRQLGRRERKIGLAEPPGHETDRNAKRSLVRGMHYIVDGAAKPRDAAIVGPLRYPRVGKLEKAMQHGGPGSDVVRASRVGHRRTYVPGMDFWNSRVSG